MKAAGIIVEINPLHNGHVEHIQETRQLTGRDHVVAVMSGNYVQRGEPALCDKWLRTRMALLAGADIVLELPLPYVLGGADYFARAGVGLLAATGVCDCLCFGSECGDLAAIQAGACVLAQEPPLYKEALREKLAQGESFATARGAGLAAVWGTAPEGLFTKPNNGLGMEYCKALHLLGNPMAVYTSHRQPGGPSATAIRRAMAGGMEEAEALVCASMPPYAHALLRQAAAKGSLTRLDDFSDIFRYKLLDAPQHALGMAEGLHHRFRAFSPAHHRLSALLAAVKCKRYTLTRLQRVAMAVVLGLTQAHMARYEAAGGPPYLRVLGFKKTAAPLLGEMTRRATLPVLTTGAGLDAVLAGEGAAAHMLAAELHAGDVYGLLHRHAPGGERGRGLVVEG